MWLVIGYFAVCNVALWGTIIPQLKDIFTWYESRMDKEFLNVGDIETLMLLKVQPL